jgi:hypothetical protein
MITERRNQPCASARSVNGSAGLAHGDNVNQETAMKTLMVALCAFGISISGAYAHHIKHPHEARRNVSAASHKKSFSAISGQPAHDSAGANSSIDNPEPASNY